MDKLHEKDGEDDRNVEKKLHHSSVLGKADTETWSEVARCW